MHKPGSLQVIRAVGWVTFLEIVRDKVLYNIVLCSVLLFSLGFLASKLSAIRPERVILDFGLSAVILSCGMIAIFTGSGLLAKEFDRRTIHVALAHPITRLQFVLGKFAGLVGVLFVNWLLLVGTYFVILSATWSGLAFLSETLALALFLALIQSFAIASIAIVFSTVSTTSLSVILSIGLYLIGNNITQLKLVAAREDSQWISWALKGIASILPNLEYFNLGSKVTYGLPVSHQFIGVALVYGGILISLMLFFAGVLINNREV